MTSSCTTAFFRALLPVPVAALLAVLLGLGLLPHVPLVAAQALNVPVATIVYDLEWADGATGEGTFTLLDNGTFEDAQGNLGRWVQQGTPTRLTLRYRASQACGALLQALVAADDTLQGRMACRDGSGRQGTWSGTLLPAPFQLGAVGCPMAHCDPQMSDWVGSRPPGPGATLLWHDAVESAPGVPMGSGPGLGCSSNGRVAACTFGMPPPLCGAEARDLLRVYRLDESTALPVQQWGSGDRLNCTAFASAPMVAVDGGVVAADDSHVLRWAPDGTVLWQTATPGGYPD